MECYAAYKAGRAEKDPSVNWYEGEIGFFDYYIIPLAKKLKECGVFGVSSGEYLDYAMRNRQVRMRSFRLIRLLLQCGRGLTILCMMTGVASERQGHCGINAGKD